MKACVILLNCHNDSPVMSGYSFAAYHAIYGSIITADTLTLKKPQKTLTTFDLHHGLKRLCLKVQYLLALSQ